MGLQFKSRGVTDVYSFSVSHIGMYGSKGYGFKAAWSDIGYIFFDHLGLELGKFGI